MKKLLTILAVTALAVSCSSEAVENDFRESITPEKPTGVTPQEPTGETPEEPAPEPPNTETDTIAAPGEVEPEVKFGLLTFNSDLGSKPTAKGAIPICGDSEPKYIIYTLEDNSGNSFFYQSNVAIQGNTVFSIEPTEVPPGTYSVTDLTLFDDSGKQTHKVPDASDEDFAKFTDRPTPFNITIVEGEESDAGSDIMCFAGEEVYTTIGGNTVTEIRALNMYLTYDSDGLSHCIERLTVDLWWKGQTEPERIYDVEKRVQDGSWIAGRYSAFVPLEMDSVKASSWAKEDPSGVEYMEEQFTFTKENFPSEHISDMVYFSDSCD